MPRILNIEADKEQIQTNLTRLFQSGNINFLIGSGASMPAINIAGDIENKVGEHFLNGEENEGQTLLYNFLKNIQIANKPLISKDLPPKETGETVAEYEIRINNFKSTLNFYTNFINSLELILNERKTNILPKQANIFTTNYDLFFEKSCQYFPALRLNDGFTRTPSLSGAQVFSSKCFFNSLFNNGNLYSYKVEIPSVNLIKIHGSLSWKKVDSDILFSIENIELPADENKIEEIKKFNSEFSLILPENNKFRETVMDRIYYDLLRLYANELDKENTLLIAFGFSFADEHIFDITKRALKNPTLKLVIFGFDNDACNKYLELFTGFSNVEIIAPVQASVNTFETLNTFLEEIPGFQGEL